MQLSSEAVGLAVADKVSWKNKVEVTPVVCPSLHPHSLAASFESGDKITSQ